MHITFFLQLALVALSSVATVHAHTRFTTLFVDGTNQGDGTCVRMSFDEMRTTYPIESITSPDMACGLAGETGVARVCPANAGSTLTFEFRVWPDASHPGALDPLHKGPCSVFMKKVDSALANNTAAGDGWFKIWDESYDEAAGKWCTEKMIENNGLISVNVPDDIEGGYYLVRPELLALHAAQNTPPDPQFFVGCAQLFIDSDGSAKPDTISIPDGYVNIETPGMTFNIYTTPLALPYPMYGPPVYNSTSTSALVTSNSTSQQTEGLEPPNCILENANWCGFEINSYSNETACWDANKQCWLQSTACWADSGPTGGSNCKLWDQKCQDMCQAGNFTGPPNKGVIITPVKPSLAQVMGMGKRFEKVKEKRHMHRRGRIGGRSGWLLGN